MRTNRYKKALALVLITAITTSAFAQDGTKKLQTLETKDDPTQVGKRDINKGQLAFYSIQREIALGRQMANEIDRSSPQVTDPAVIEYVNRVAQNIVLHSDAKIPFTVKVIDSQDVNAFALPGGFLYVNRGLLEAAENEAEVAGVLSHEIAHVTARHGIEQASKGELLNYASIPLIFFGGLGGYLVRQVAGLAVPLTFLKFSRGAEKEADRLGAQYMWSAGYDPTALITFFEKLQAQDKRKPGTLAKVFSTHPLTGDRITEVRGLIQRFPDRGEYQISTSEFGQVRSRLLATASGGRGMGAGRDSNDRRPTLKRRPQGTDSGSDSGNGSYSESGDRPVLRRSGEPDAKPSASETSSDPDTGRPTLKRSEGSSSSTASPASSTPSSTPETTSDSGTGRPVLKRSDGSSTAEPTKTQSTDSGSSERPKLKRKDSDN
jgi:predicted Zn-dependent protease